MSTGPVGASTSAIVVPPADPRFPMPLLAQLCNDSLDLAEVLIELGKDLGAAFPCDVAERFRTVGNAVAFLRGGPPAE